MIPLALVTGFLGSGKTTLLRYLAGRYRGRNIVWLVNEFSMRDVDAALLGREAENVVSISGGSIFCRCLVTEFIERLRDLPARFGKPAEPVEGVIVEASGIADPAAAGAMLRESRLDALYGLAAIIAIADPGSFLKLLRTLPNIPAQIKAASYVLVNKTDLYSPVLIERTEAAVREINPAAAIIRTSHCAADVDVFALIGGIAARGQLAECRDPRFVSYSVPVPYDLDLGRLREAVDAAGDDVLRIKGFARHGGRCYYVDYSPSGWRIEAMSAAGLPALALIVRSPCTDAVRRLMHAIQHQADLLFPVKEE